LQEIGQPWAFRRLNTMLSSELPLRVRMDMLPTGAMHTYGDWRVYIGKREENGTLRDIVVMQPQAEGRAQAFYADSAQLVNENGQAVLKLAHGHFIGSDEQGRSRHIVFETNSITVPKLKPRESERERNAATLPQLLEMERKNAQDFALTQNQVVMGTLTKDRNEISKRFSFPLMCLAVTFVAAPLGARTRKAGRSFTFASGLLIVVLYYVMRQIFEPQSLTPLWLTMLRGQGPNLILLTAGLFLIWRVDRV
jgi:lipopolysaccharide export LptBFGC system permease protein LptF